MELFKENNFIGGNSARGYGMIEIPIQIPKNASEEYLEYLNSNKDEIKKYFQEKTI
jgi:CRISPR/Cas system CSM-associated protein Csm3 (group 7 of RAMP superfamily)